MTDLRASAAAVLALDDHAWLTLDAPGREQLKEALAEALRGDEGPPAPPSADDPVPAEPVLALGAPARVVVEGAVEAAEEVRQDLPILIGGRTTGLRDWQVDAVQNLRALVVDLETGALRTRRAILTHKRTRTRPPSGSGPRPEPFHAATWSIELRHITDMRARYDLAWRPGRLAITAIEYDLRSNTAVVARVSALPEEERSLPARPAPRLPSAALTRAEAHAATPALEGDGGAFTVPERVEAEAPIPFEARVRLPVSGAALIPRLVPEAEGDDEPAEADERLLAVSVLAIALDAEAPLQLDLAVPATLSGDPSAPTAEAAFGLDLRSALAPGSGTYQVYLVAGERVVGPQPLEVTPR